MSTNHPVGPDVSPYQDWHTLYYSIPGSWSLNSTSSTVNSSCDFVTVHSTSSTEAENGDLGTARDRRLTESSLALVHLHRRSYASGNDIELRDDSMHIEKLISQVFRPKTRTAGEKLKARHVGIVWRNLTVRGAGLGAAIQPTNGHIFLGLPRLMKRLLVGATKPPVRTILDNFTGCVRPGEMLLVLGRPGSGCSTFLKVIGNQRSGYESIDGEVCYGAESAETMARKYRSEILYNPEDDLHHATLTVQDTILFALKARALDKTSWIRGETRREYREKSLSVIAKLFWIEHVLNTRIGNELIRGISGGEKKRVSIGEAMVTRATTQCWDNSTKGLDANTALEYVQSLRSLTNTADTCTLVALYQASESLYNLFDKVILIEKGKCVYFGRTEDAKTYFEGLGFECPHRWTTPDFLASVCDPNARHIRRGWSRRAPRTSDEFLKAYLASDAFQAANVDVEDFEMEIDDQEAAPEAAPDVSLKTNYITSFHEQVRILAHRQILIIFGDKRSLVGKWGAIIFLALITGSVFYDLPKTSSGVFTRGGVLFLILLYNVLLAMAELSISFHGHPILLKHKSFSFYRPSAYALAQVVVDIPLVFIQVTIFSLVVYFMANLARTASQFFICFLFIFMLTMSMYSFFRALGALCPSLDAATGVAGVSIQAFVVYTGYLIPPWKMHPWLKWLARVNPIQYSYEALLSNEFYDMEIQCEPPYIVPDGPNVLANHQSCAIMGSAPDRLVIHGSDYIEAAFGYSRSHLWRNFGILTVFLAFFIALTMLGMELRRPNKGGCAVTVFKRDEAPKLTEASAREKPHADVETGKRSDVPDFSNSGLDTGQRRHVLSRGRSVFTWKDVSYSVPFQGGYKRLLHGVQGYVKPGCLTALMGASGAGKTTLLNVLAQRISLGVVTGSFLIDGKLLPKSFQRATGFAEQVDIHEPTATVRESLQFSALLRQPKEVSLEEKYAYCEKVIDLLEMRDIAGATVGSVGSGLSQEQRKRLTIAVELASKPELLLFLDEPTSGLDSLAAFNIVRLLRRLADAGQAILCTIHQPSAVLFEQFDSLLLLQSGGQVVYNGALGPDCRILIEYFERNGGKQCLPDANPAEYVLEVIGAGNPSYNGPDWREIWASSPENRQVLEEINSIKRVGRRKRRAADDKRDDEFAAPLWMQIKITTKRTLVSYWRTPGYTMGKLMLHIVAGLFNMLTFWDIGDSYIDMQSRLFSVFLTFTMVPPLMQQLQPRYLHFRNLYQSREANSKIYSWTAFVISAILPELPYSIVAGTVFFNCWYWGIQFSRDPFVAGYTWMFLMLFEAFYVGFGQFIAALAPNALFASLLVPSFFTFVVSFCGTFVPYEVLPPFWRSWMYWLTPFHYLLEGLLSVLTHNVSIRCLPREETRFSPPTGQSCSDYAKAFIQQAGGYVSDSVDASGLCSYCRYSSGDQFAASFNMFYSHRWRDYGIFTGYVLFNFGAVFLFSWLYLHGARDSKRRFSAQGTRKC